MIDQSSKSSTIDSISSGKLINLMVFHQLRWTVSCYYNWALHFGWSKATRRTSNIAWLAHKQLRKGGVFTVKQLRTNSKSELVLQKCNDNEEFHAPTEIDWAKHGVYWRRLFSSIINSVPVFIFWYTHSDIIFTSRTFTECSPWYWGIYTGPKKTWIL